MSQNYKKLMSQNYKTQKNAVLNIASSEFYFINVT